MRGRIELLEHPHSCLFSLVLQTNAMNPHHISSPGEEPLRTNKNGSSPRLNLWRAYRARCTRFLIWSRCRLPPQKACSLNRSPRFALLSLAGSGSPRLKNLQACLALEILFFRTFEVLLIQHYLHLLSHRWYS